MNLRIKRSLGFVNFEKNFRVGTATQVGTKLCNFVKSVFPVV